MDTLVGASVPSVTGVSILSITSACSLLAVCFLPSSVPGSSVFLHHLPCWPWFPRFL